MSNPSSPNYRSGVGRLVTDRFDFQNHVDGYDFRHTAGNIDLSPTVTIDSVVYSDVQTAMEAITASLEPPTIADATDTVKGIIKLTSDLSGSADFPQVAGLRGIPVSNSIPNTSDVLMFNGSLWASTALISTYIAGGDLTGVNADQKVVNLTGTDGLVTITATTVGFLQDVVSPTINQGITTGAAGNLSIIGQASSGGGQPGGDVIISGGAPGSGGLKGGARIQINTSNMLHAAQVVSSQRVLGLVSGSAVTSTNMPSSTGDLVIFVGDAAVAPSAAPSGGAILYSSSGKLNIMQQDATSFVIGSIPNPSVWGDTGQQTYTYRTYTQSTSGSRVLAVSYALEDNTLTKVDAIIIGKKTGSTDSAIFNLSDGYVRNGGGSPTQVGSSITSADPRTLGGASSWTIPTISISSNTLQVYTGANSSTTINWTVVVQLVTALSA